MPDLTSAWGRNNPDLLEKWNPAQPRDPIGQFAADDGDEAEEEPRGRRPSDADEARAAQAALDAAETGPGTDPAKAAEAAARRKYGIPSSKKKFGKLPAAARAAARKVLAAERRAARVASTVERAERRVKAIRDELQKPAGAKTKRALRERLSKATKVSATAAAKLAVARAAVSTAASAWAGQKK